MSSTDPTGPTGPPGEPDLEGTPDLTVRLAGPADAETVAEIHLAARLGAVGAMPPPVHPPDEVRAWLAGRLERDEVWLAEADGRAVGYARLGDGWLDDLYVLPSHARCGIGGVLLELVKSRMPDGFALWVFESNGPARAFYARHGLIELERTDGTGNEERCPDLRMAWTGRQPLAYLRACIDAVDTDLVGLLDRRVALSRAVQEIKAADGPAERDPEREAAIVARMAGASRTLDEAGLRQVVDALITATLGGGPGR